MADDELKEGMNPDEPVYLQKLHEISITGSPYLPINCKHLKDFDADLNRQLISYPQVTCAMWIDSADGRVDTQLND